jgi:glutathione S-transferase
MRKLYRLSNPSAGPRTHTRDLRVLWAAEEMQPPIECPGTDDPAGDLSSQACHQLSPFAQVTVVRPDRLGGKPSKPVASGSRRLEVVV